jgi:hypothetical protein
MLIRQQWPITLSRVHSQLSKRRVYLTEYERTSQIIALKPKFIQTICKNYSRTEKKTQLFIITEISRLTLFKETIAVYS